MSQKIIYLCIFLGALRVSAQDSLTNNHFTFALVNGVSLSKFTSEAGTRKPETSGSVFHGFNFQYTRNLTEHFSLSGIAGLGFLPFTYKITETESFPGTSTSSYFSRSQYQVFSNLALQGAYRGKISPKYSYRIHAGLGVRNFARLDYSIYGVGYSFTGEFRGDPKPYATIGAGMIKQLRNKEELSLHLSYEQSFKDVYSGNYALSGGSYGTFSNSGSNFNLALAYTFTGSTKREKIAKLIETNPDKKAAKKLYRKEIRYIDPKSTFISLTGGLGFGTNRVSDQGNSLDRGTFASFVPRITVEKGFSRNYFAEAGFNYFPYWTVIHVGGMMSGSSAFDAYQLSAGVGKRIITKNNYNIINFHAGLSFAGTNQKKGSAGSSVQVFYLNDATGQQPIPLVATSEHIAVRSFITSAYIGASKDFRLVRNFYLSLGYRFQQGFYKVYEQQAKYTTGNDPEVKNASITLNGSSHVFHAGFKVKVGPRPVRHYTGIKF